MKSNSAIIVWALTSVFIVVAGCISLGDNTSPGAPSQNPSATASTGNPGQQTVSQGLTDAQKIQATNIAKGDSAVKEILGRSGYSITGVFAGGAGTAVVYIEGGDTARSDGSIWTPDMYQVAVDLNNNKVTGIDHIEPKALPTPQP